MTKLRQWSPWAWSAGLPGAPTTPSFLRLAVLEAHMSKQAAMPCPKSVKLLSWAHGSLRLRQIGREDIALD